MQKIIIKNFGPIQECELNIDKYLVLIGPQASGKSTISKAIYFFKSLRDDLIKYIIEASENGNFDKAVGTYAKIIRKKFLTFWGTTHHLDNIYLNYIYKPGISITITLEKTGKYVTPNFSPDFSRNIKDIVALAKKYYVDNNDTSNIFTSSSDLLFFNSGRRLFISNIEKLIRDLFDDYQELVFIPAGRSLLATLSDQIQVLTNITNITERNKIDYLTLAFLDSISKYKSFFSRSLPDIVLAKKKLTQEVINKETTQLAMELIQKVLKGTYIYDNDGEKIYFNDKSYVKLNFSSSGQQEAIWILHLIFLLILENKNVFVIIEEPEAHLYPESQKQIIELIYLLGNSNDNKIIITTHSPYILAAINNLIYSKKIGALKKKEVEKRIHPKLWVDINHTGAYFIKDGCKNKIIDEKLGLIRVEAIDSAASLINDDYDFLFDLDEFNLGEWE